MKKYLLLTGLISTTLLPSCTKDINNGSKIVAIEGNWVLVSHSVQYKSDIQSLTNGFQTYDDTVYNFSTTYNHGGITITADSIFSINLAYGFEDTLRIHQYGDNVATHDTVYQDHQAVPINLNSFIEDSSIPYQEIGDSLYFPNGITYFQPIFSFATSFILNGAKASLAANQLTLTWDLDQSYPYPYDIGVPGAAPVYHVKIVVKDIFHK